MAYGDGTEDSIAGEIHHRDVDPVPDAEPDPPTILDDPLLGMIRVDESRGRVLRKGNLIRREQDGRPLAILGTDTYWIWLDGNAVPTAFPRGRTAWGIGLHGIVERHPASRWEGDDFTKLTGPIEAAEFLGRRAWTFELAPPRHKPYPIQLTVDAETGLVLRQANADFGSFVEWTSLQVGADLPDALFGWDGPTLAPPDRRAEYEREMTQRREWLAGRGIDRLEFRVEPRWTLHEWHDATGTFHASFDASSDGSLLRRPHSDEPWPDLAQMNWEHHYAWSDERWDWFVGCRRHIDDEAFAVLRRQLADST